jgi:hypothetical protein
MGKKLFFAFNVLTKIKILIFVVVIAGKFNTGGQGDE